jgi:HSP20 family protein
MSLRDLIPWTGNKRDPAPRGEDSPFHELQSRVNDLFESFWRGEDPWNARSAPMTFAPKLEVSEDDDTVTVRAEMPGMTAEDVDLSISGNVLVLKGEKKEEKTEERKGVAYTERSYGSFRREVPLPGKVEEEQVSATFANGVLTVTLPKSEEAKQATRRIEVKGD